METKKLKKLSINKMVDFPVIEEQEQMALKGGDGYTLDEVSDMIDAGTWKGGYVDGVGYVGIAAPVEGDGDIYWDKEGKWDIDGCRACDGYSPVNTGIQSGAESHLMDLWIHRLFHRGVYY